MLRDNPQMFIPETVSHTAKIRQRTRLDARCTKIPKVSPVKKCVRNTGEADER